MESKSSSEISPSPKPAYPFIEPKEILRLALERNGLYTILGLQPSATSSDIKTAYRRIALDFHPDKLSKFKDKFNIDTTEVELTECFKYFNEAGSLSDPSQRKEYDKHTNSEPIEEDTQRKASKSRTTATPSTKQATANQSQKRASTSSQNWHEQFYQKARQNKIKKLHSALEKAGMSTSEGMLDDRIIRLCDLIEQLTDADLLNANNLTKIIELFSADNSLRLPDAYIRILDNLFETLSEHLGLFTQDNLDKLLTLRAKEQLNELNDLTKLLSEKKSLDQDVFDRSLALLHNTEIMNRHKQSTVANNKQYSDAKICLHILENIHRSIELTPLQIKLIFEHLINLDYFKESIPADEAAQADFWSIFFENPHEVFYFLNEFQRNSRSFISKNKLDWQDLGFTVLTFFTLKKAGIASTAQDYHPTQYMRQLYLLTHLLESCGLLNTENANLLLATKTAPHNRLVYFRACKRFNLLPQQFQTNETLLETIRAPKIYAQLIPLFLFSNSYDSAAGKVRSDIQSQLTSIRYMFQYPNFLIEQLAPTKSNIINESKKSNSYQNLASTLNRIIQQRLITSLEQSLATQQAMPPAIVNPSLTTMTENSNSPQIHQPSDYEDYNPHEKSQFTALDHDNTGKNNQPGMLLGIPDGTEKKRSTPIQHKASPLVHENDSSTTAIPTNQHNPVVTLPHYNMAFFLKCLCLSLLVCALSILILSYAAPGLALNLGLVLHCSVKSLQYAAGTGALFSLVGLFALNQNELNMPPSANLQSRAPVI